MERRVKERLVGATILAVLVVLIVPELLSGPKRAVVVPQAALPGTAEPVRSVTVDLATNKATAGETPGAAGAGEAPATDPAAAEGAEDGAARGADVASPPEATPPAPVTSPAPTAGATTAGVTTPAATSAVAETSGVVHHGWAAQLGSFAGRGNAEKLERQLRAQGFTPFLSATGSGRALRYRVRVGPSADRAAVEKVIARLQKAGHTASVVAP